LFAVSALFLLAVAVGTKMQKQEQNGKEMYFKFRLTIVLPGVIKPLAPNVVNGISDTVTCHWQLQTF
jgi:hypothetical protein